ncbi:MAG: LytTR family DNA-binding domain-containing protein, partial [Bacteroidota bacterium]
TAYDEYAIQAFKHNSIDYLLKPIREEDLDQALAKFQKQHAQGQPSVNYAELLQMIQPAQSGGGNYLKRILIRMKESLKAVPVSEIAYFFIESRITFLCTHEGKRYPIDQNLDQLEVELDPTEFFRINRQFIIKADGIQKMYTHTKSRLKLMLKPAIDKEVVVSSERSAAFKEWLRRG